ncbi:MAG: hypothetical protein HUK15_09215 [Bacteroidales bacterium]|nr:hypothetical protein [Bacteroidales bacterium]
MKIRKAYKIILGFILITAYIVGTGIYVSDRYKNLRFKSIDISIDNAYAFLNKELIFDILGSGGVVIDSTVKISNIDFAEIERIISENIYVDEVQAYSDFSGNIFLNIKQRSPMLRVMTKDSVSFYIDSDKKVMPLCDYYSAALPVLSGNLLSECFYSSDSVDNYFVNRDDKSPKIDDICTFVDYLQKDELWRNQIVQIYVNASNEFELVPMVGNHIILLGKLNDYEEKMNKLKAMYDKGFKITDWNAYSLINLKYKNQVICKKNRNGQ